MPVPGLPGLVTVIMTVPEVAIGRRRNRNPELAGAHLGGVGGLRDAVPVHHGLGAEVGSVHGQDETCGACNGSVSSEWRDRRHGAGNGRRGLGALSARQGSCDQDQSDQ
jgi:hypothetical protein